MIYSDLYFCPVSLVSLQDYTSQHNKTLKVLKKIVLNMNMHNTF